MLIRREPKPGRLLRLGAGPWLSFQSSTKVSPCAVRVTDHVKADAAGRLGQAAVLAGVGRELVQGHAQSEGRIRLEEYIRSLDGYAIEKRGKQRVEQLVERSRLPATLGDEPVCVGQSQDPGLILRHQIGDTARVLGGLREQARAVARTDFRSGAATPGSSVRGAGRVGAAGWPRRPHWRRSKKRYVIIMKLAPLGRVRAEHAIGAAVVPRDRER